MPSDDRHLSIGEVISLLVAEFPDITISKVRFLESQGLIDPDRTPSGYRKFSDADVERLRAILRGQREQFLPLRVIKERLDTGELERPVSTPGGGPAEAAGPSPAAPPTGGGAPSGIESNGAPFGTTSTTSAEQLCEAAGVDVAFLDELESYGIVTSGRLGGWRTFDTESVDAVLAAAELQRLGIEPRHLRLWRQGVDKEMALIEQLVLPILAQRQPEARLRAAETAARVLSAGSDLRTALLAKALRYLVS